jgi:hypothetical protein
MNTKEQLLRDHRLYHRWFRELSGGKLLYNADKSLKTKKDITNNHGFLVDQMIKNHINHYLVDDLDEFLDNDVKKLCMVKDLLKLPREYVVIKDFLALRDDGIILRSKLFNNKNLVDLSQSIEMVKRILKMQESSLECTSLSNDSIVPLYDLILRRKMTTLPRQQEGFVKLWVGDCERKTEDFIGMSNIINKNVDALIDYEANKIPFENDSTSELVFCNLLNQTYAPALWMKEAHRVLSDGGLLHFETLSIKSGGLAHPYDKSYINKDFFAFWTVQGLLGDRPKFDLVDIQESLYDEDFENIVVVQGTLKAVKSYVKPFFKDSDSCAIVNAEILADNPNFGVFGIGLKDETGNLVEIGHSHPTDIDIKVNDKVSVFVDGLYKEEDKFFAQQIIILEKSDDSEDIDLVEQVLKDKEEEELVKLKVIRQDKASDEYHLVYGVVAEPGLEDSDGHWSSADDIREDAHTFLARRRNVKISHFLPSDSEIVESYMSPVDWTAPDGQVIKKDSWVAVIRVKEAEVWNGIENGDIVGFSKGGLAVKL